MHLYYIRKLSQIVGRDSYRHFFLYFAYVEMSFLQEPILTYRFLKRTEF